MVTKGDLSKPIIIPNMHVYPPYICKRFMHVWYNLDKPIVIPNMHEFMEDKHA